MKPVVKICGMMRSEDVGMCIGYGVDIIGIVVEHTEPVPWSVCVPKAKELIAACGDAAKSCVVTDGGTGKLLQLAYTLKPDYIQMHFGGSVEETAQLVNKLKNYCGTKLIVTLFPETLQEEAVQLSKTGAAALLLDKRRPGKAAIGGIAELHLFKRIQYAVSCPVILAGGLKPANIEQMLRFSQARMIDIMTGVEVAPGIKDEVKVAALFRSLPMQ